MGGSARRWRCPPFLQSGTPGSSPPWSPGPCWLGPREAPGQGEGVHPLSPWSCSMGLKFHSAVPTRGVPAHAPWGPRLPITQGWNHCWTDKDPSFSFLPRSLAHAVPTLGDCVLPATRPGPPPWEASRPWVLPYLNPISCRCPHSPRQHHAPEGVRCGLGPVPELSMPT